MTLSQFLYRAIPIAITAATAAMIIPIGPISAVKAAPIAGATIIIEPKNISSGPPTANMPAIATAIFANTGFALNMLIAFSNAGTSFSDTHTDRSAITGARAEPMLSLISPIELDSCFILPAGVSASV